MRTNHRYRLQIRLLSDTTFGSGGGVAGLVDVETEHDTQTGLPVVGGKTLRGLIVEECANLLYSLSYQQQSGELDKPCFDAIESAAFVLLGSPGSRAHDEGLLHVGMARLPDDLQKSVRYALAKGVLTPDDVFESLTTIRRQTAVDDETSAPEPNSLRAIRVVLRETLFEAEITLHRSLDLTVRQDRRILALLALSIRTVRRGGLGRNRGRGHLEARLLDMERAEIALDFEALVAPAEEQK